MIKWVATIISVIITLLLVSTLFVLIFGRFDNAPYLIKFFVGGGVPVWVARTVFRHFDQKGKPVTVQHLHKTGERSADELPTAKDALPIAEQQSSDYSCSRCGSTLAFRMARCPKCNEILEWDKENQIDSPPSTPGGPTPTIVETAKSGLHKRSRNGNIGAIAVLIVGCVVLFIATSLDTAGNFSYVLGAYIAKLLGYTFFLGLPTFLIARGMKKAPQKAFRVFAWLFLSAAAFDFLPYFMRPSFSPAETNDLLERMGSYGGQNQPSSTDSPSGEELWTTVIIKGIGTIEIPPTMEVQSGKYKEFVDTQRKLKGYKTPQLVIQPKGINDLEQEPLAKYARVLISKEVHAESMELGLYFDFADFTPDDVSELNTVFQEQILSQLPQEIKILEWYPLELKRVNRMSAMRIGFRRRLRDNPPVVVYSYKFFNFYETYELTVSYRQSESEYWKNDLTRLVNSFSIRH